MVQIDISTMSSGVHALVLHPPAEDLGLSDDDFDEIEARVRLDIGDHQILVHLDVAANARVMCDRTLVPFAQPVNGAFTVVFTKRQIESSDVDETVRPIDPAAREIDLTEEIRDTIVLSVPLRNVAPEASEAELVLTYGELAGASIDPRWEALRKLKTG